MVFIVDDYLDKLNPTQLDIYNKATESTFDPKFRGLALNMPMGCGKTRTMLMIGLKLYPRFLWICNKTLITSVVNEIQLLFNDKVKYEILHRESLYSRFDNWRPNSQTRIIITTPETVVRSYKNNNIEQLFVYQEEKTIYYRIPRHCFADNFMINDNESETEVDEFNDQSGPELLHAHNWQGIVIDESQNYTNCKTSTCRALSSLACQHRWLLSGTQIQEPKLERILGFFLLLNQFQPNNLNSCKEIISNSNFPGLNAYGLECDPPTIDTEVEYQEISYKMTTNESKCYDFFEQIIKEWQDYYDNQKHSLPPNDPKLNKIRGHLLSLFTYLKLSLFSPRYALEKLLEKIESIEELDELVHQIQDIRDLLNEYPISPHTSRLEQLKSIIESKVDEQIIIFSSYNITIQQMMDYLRLFGNESTKQREMLTINSQLSLANRQKILNQFKSNSNAILFINYQIGAEGLNLQSAKTVVFSDLYWNHHKHLQAIARIHRQGQLHKQINICYILSNTNFEYEMLNKQKQKVELINQLNQKCVKQQLKADSITISKMFYVHQDGIIHNTFWKN